MATYKVQKMPYNNVDNCTEALNKAAEGNYEIIYITAENGKLIVVFQKKLGRPRAKKTG